VVGSCSNTSSLSVMTVKEVPKSMPSSRDKFAIKNCLPPLKVSKNYGILA